MTDQLQRHLLAELQTAAAQLVPAEHIPSELHLEHPAQTDHGDYATNLALQLYGAWKAADPELPFSSPRALAEAVVSQLKPSLQSELISDVTVAGPGFINFRLSNTFLWQCLETIVSTDLVSLCHDPSVQNQAVIVEYSSPNIAKPFTIGHLRSTIIGDALANLHQAVGYSVFRDNHLGDWGTQFGKQIYAIKTWGDEAALDASPNPVKDLVELYVKFHQEAETDPSIEDQGREWFRRLETGDQEARRLWQKCIDWSWQEFARIYEKLGVTFTENDGRGYGESFFEDKMADVVALLREKNYLIQSEGAELFFFPDEKFPPMMILKKDGSSLYATRDLATDKFRKDHYPNLVKIINEVGIEQSLYFQQLFEIEKTLGWFSDGERVHVGHGHYRFEDKKMSTRKGNVIWLQDVLEEAFVRVKKAADGRIDDHTAWQVAIGAIKWQDLRREAQKSIVFDYDEMLSLDGNSGPYLQYTWVRANSVLKKAGDIALQIKTQKDSKVIISDDLILSSAELDIFRLLYQYCEIVRYSTETYQPHHLCTYLYQLAQSFNSFYNQHQILPANEAWDSSHLVKLYLTMGVSDVLQQGLQLLGISTVERM